MITPNKHRQLMKSRNVNKLHMTPDGKLELDMLPVRDMMPKTPMNTVNPSRPINFNHPQVPLMPTRVNVPTTETTQDLRQHQTHVPVRPQFMSAEMLPIHQVLTQILDELKKLNAK